MTRNISQCYANMLFSIYRLSYNCNLHFCLRVLESLKDLIFTWQDRKCNINTVPRHFSLRSNSLFPLSLSLSLLSSLISLYAHQIS